MQLKKNAGKVGVAVMLVGIVLWALPTLALAKNEALMYKGIEMMAKASNVMEDAVGTIKKGQGMYVQICQEKGCITDVAQGNKVIDDGVKQAGQGLDLLEEGQKAYKKAKGKNLKAAQAAAQKMIEGGRMVQDSLKVIEDGVKMNNQVLEAKKLASQVEAPTGTILAGVKSGLTGIKQFLEGQKMFLQNK